LGSFFAATGVLGAMACLLMFMNERSSIYHGVPESVNGSFFT
jgi:hypothetical protein